VTDVEAVTAGAAQAGRAARAKPGSERARPKRAALTGNEAVALAMRQIDPDVVAAYPITPQTDIVQYFSSFVADGGVRTEFVTVESEHSAMSATVGAAAAGARAMTATAANGLALMWEVLYIASGSRLPIVMPVVNRALSAPINIHCDHSDAMGARDSGWIQLWSEDAQEAYDNVIQAVRVAEDPRVLLPVMVCFDGFIISHALLNLHVLPDEAVKDFIGTYRPEHTLLDPEHPITVGPNSDIEIAAQLIYKYKIGGIPVVTRGKLVGIITESDLLRAFVDMMGILNASSRIDVVVGNEKGQFKKAMQIIVESGGEIINLGMSPQRSRKRMYSFRLAPCKTSVIKKALEADGFRVVAAMD